MPILQQIKKIKYRRLKEAEIEGPVHKAGLRYPEEMLSNYWISRDLAEMRNDSIGQSSSQDQRSNRIGIIFLFATTCIMLCCKNEIKDPNNPFNNQWDQILIRFYTLFSLFNYLTICALLCNVRMCNPILILICLMFVSISGVLFAYLRNVNPGIHLLTIFWQTLLIMDTFALFFFFLATFIKPRGGGIGGAGETSALLLNHSDFQTLRHPCPTVNPSSIYS